MPFSESASSGALAEAEDDISEVDIRYPFRGELAFHRKYPEHFSERFKAAKPLNSFRALKSSCFCVLCHLAFPVTLRVLPSSLCHLESSYLSRCITDEFGRGNEGGVV